MRCDISQTKEAKGIAARRFYLAVQHGKVHDVSNTEDGRADPKSDNLHSRKVSQEEKRT